MPPGPTDTILVRCTGEQARAALLNDPPSDPEDRATLLARVAADPPLPDMISWALVPASDPTTTDMLSHCVTYRRRAIVRPAQQDGKGDGFEDAVAYGLAAVWTPIPHRRKGYARRMLQLLHYALAADMPPFPEAWGQQPEGPRDARFHILHSAIDTKFYLETTQGEGSTARAGWVGKPPHTRLWNIGGAPADPPAYEMMSAADVSALQGEYEDMFRSTLRPGEFAVVPNVDALVRLGAPSVLGGHFGARVDTGWFTYLKLRPNDKQPWRLTISAVHGHVPFAVAAAVAAREGANVIEHSGEFADWDENGVEIDPKWPRPCVCIYGDETLEWRGPETLIIEALGAPRHWAWY